jgi:hypothetical protein
MACGKITFKPSKNCSYAMKSSVSRKNTGRNSFHESVLDKDRVRGGVKEKRAME